MVYYGKMGFYLKYTFIFILKRVNFIYYICCLEMPGVVWYMGHSYSPHVLAAEVEARYFHT